MISPGASGVVVMDKQFAFSHVETKVDPLFGMRVEPNSEALARLTEPEPGQPDLDTLQVGEAQIRRDRQARHRYKVTRIR